MRIFLPGDDPRVDCLKQIASGSGHELTDSVGDADVVLCCQALLGPIFRDDTLRLLKRLGNQLVRPITFCLVSFEPNTAWPAGFCHCGDTTLRGNTAHPWHMTRAHYRSHMPDRASELVLGADCQEAINILRDAWEPMTDRQPPLEVESVFRAELAAEAVITA